MVVSLYASQRVSLCSQVPGLTKTFIDVDSFDTEDGSLYILDPNDDLFYYHRARFRGSRDGKVRIAITFRWLGHRMPYLCGDYKGNRKHCEAYGCPRRILEQKNKNKTKLRALVPELYQGLPNKPKFSKS